MPGCGSGRPDRLNAIRRLRDIGVELVTTPNFSLFPDQPRWGRHARHEAHRATSFMKAVKRQRAVEATKGRIGWDRCRTAPDGPVDELLAHNWLLVKRSHELVWGAALGRRAAYDRRAKAAPVP